MDKIRERFQKIVEESQDLKEALYLINGEYLFKQYEYMAFEKMLRMKWELVG